MTRETDYFKSFCRISKAFGTAATREELLNLIVDNATASMEGKAACLFLADERQDLFVQPACFISSSMVPRWPEPGFPMLTFLPFKPFQPLMPEFLPTMIWMGSG